MQRAYRPSIVLLGFTMAVLFFLTGIPTDAAAHPPKDVQIGYDAASNTITVSITHTSASLTRHYIKQVEIRKNGAVVSNNLYKSQPEKSSFSYSFAVPAQAGDVVEVTVTCNIYGKKTSTLKIGQ